MSSVVSVRQSDDGTASSATWLTWPISVIVPAHQEEKTIVETVRSLMMVNYGEFEIIVVNDGSDDPFTVELLDGYDRPKTRVITTANQGLPSARNNGIREAAST